MFGHTASHRRQSLLNLLSGIGVYGFMLLIYLLTPYYQGFISRYNIDLTGAPPFLKEALELIFSILGGNTREALSRLYLFYCLGALIKTALIFRKKPPAVSPNRPALFLLALQHLGHESVEIVHNFLTRKKKSIRHFSQEDKTSILFMIVKFFFIPIMLNFAYSNLGGLFFHLHHLLVASDFDNSLAIFYLLLLDIIFLIDVSYFCFGYLVESRHLNNTVRSVEPTLLGWMAALFCYPPFSQWTQQYLGWGSTDYIRFGNTPTTVFFLILSLLCLGLYLWATISLGAKCSNLTNRGIVSTGAYSIVRHPAYIGKNLSWLIMGLPLINFQWHWTSVNLLSQQIHLPVLNAQWHFLLSILAWMFVYFVRAITEERHLMQDKDYQHYCKKVRYRFIPGIY